MERLKSDVLVAETVQGSNWYPAISMSIVKIRSALVGWDIPVVLVLSSILNICLFIK
jgi:hypothetical protein